jgi:hypothetical protein
MGVFVGDGGSSWAMVVVSCDLIAFSCDLIAFSCDLGRGFMRFFHVFAPLPG